MTQPIKIPLSQDPVNILKWLINSSFVKKSADFIIIPYNIKAVVTETGEQVELCRWLFENVFIDLTKKGEIIIDSYKISISLRGDIGIVIQKNQNDANDTQLFPNKVCTESYYHRGLLNYQSGNIYQAICDFTEAIDLNPNYKEAYYHRGCSCLLLRLF